MGLRIAGTVVVIAAIFYLVRNHLNSRGRRRLFPCLQFRTPTPQTEKMLEESFNTTLDRYRALLSDEAGGHLELVNNNFDTGVITGPGKYRMNDDAHAKLLGKLAEQKFVGASPEVREELLHFFSEPDAPYATKRNVKAWAKVQVQLEQLKAAPPPPPEVSQSPLPAELSSPGKP